MSIRIVRRWRVSPLGFVTATLVLTTVIRSAPAAVVLQFDYSLDANNFFADPARKAALEEAGRAYSDRFLDDLSAISPGGSNTWTAVIANPATGATANISNPTISANTIRIYAGGRDLPGSTLGIGGPGGFSDSGTQGWLDTVKARGETGALQNPPTDFGPWGGAITFDTVVPWNFNISGPVGGQNDFYSVAVHELGHLLGFGPAASFSTKINASNQFTGPKSAALVGGPVPLSADKGHWADGTTSTAGGSSQETAMDPSITTGTRKYFTTLDYAGMDDLGWSLAIPGDANLDGSVTVGDLGILATNFGTQSDRRWSKADFNYDGIVSVGDLGLLATNFGQSASGALVAGPSFEEAVAAYPELAGLVPEPSSISFLLVVGLSTLSIRHQKRAYGARPGSSDSFGRVLTEQFYG